MNREIASLLSRIHVLEDEIEALVAQRRAALNVRVHDGKVAFERGVRQRQREFKIRLSHYILGARPLVIITAPFIYMAIVPFLLLDLCISLYQAICFPIYGIRKVLRADYLIFDRAQLAYLNGLEKLNCAYCSYGNGLIAYVREIAARTEQYWCPIKHAQRVLAAHGHYENFVDFSDAENYRKDLETLRQQLGKDEGPP